MPLVNSHTSFTSYVEPLFHIGFWGYGTYLVATGNLIHLDYLSDANIPTFYPVLLGSACNAVLFYGTAFIIMPGYLGKGKVGKFWTLVLALVLSVTLLETIFDFVQRPQELDSPGSQIGSVALSVLFINTSFIFTAFLYRSGKDWFKNEIIKQKLSEDKLSAELNFLKAQINPHFLFNTLNNLYSLALESKSETADSIAKLAHLMRYMIYESSEKIVDLSREIHYLENYIELQKLRTVTCRDDNPTHIAFNFNHQETPVKIPPMLLIPVVENAFKHGISTIKQSEIYIDLNATASTITLNIKNTHTKNPTGKTGGVGLRNLRRRLELLYPNRHSLTVKINGNYFYTNLYLDLADEH